MRENRISNYQEFWPFYLSQHSKPLTKKLHAIGLVVGIVVEIGVLFRSPFGLLACPVIGYSFAWYSHFFIEKNRPATFQYPVWSFISDFRMTWLVLTGKL